jgi:polygalacturonase
MRSSFARRQSLTFLAAAGLAALFAPRLLATESDTKAKPAIVPETAAAPISAGNSCPATGKDVNVLDFGAVPDGKTLATEAIQKAIDHCAAAGGGTVAVPPGVFLTHTVFLKSGVNLHLQQGAVILGDTDPKAFNKAIIHADQIENASITGLGVINGQGHAKFFPTKGPRHHDLFLFQCKNITVSDVTLLDAPSWVFRIRECDGVRVRGVTIHSYVNQNNDGIDIDAKNVTISDCTVDSEDDAICLKSDNPDVLVENVAITNCIIGSNCNAIKFGTASRGGFKNIAISNCVIRWPATAAKIPPRSTLKGCEIDAIMEAGLALEIVDGGCMDQVNISNLVMTGIQTPLFVRLGNRKGPGTLKNVVISNITATDETMLNSSITGVPGSCVENVIVKDLIFHCKGTGTMVEAEAVVPEKVNSYPQTNTVFGYSVPAYGVYVRHVRNLVLENFVFRLRNPDARPAVVLDDCHNVRLRNFDVDVPSDDQPLIRVGQSTNVTISGFQPAEAIPNLLLVEGDSTRDVKLMGNDLSRVRDVVKCKNGGKAAAVRLLNNFE